MTNGRKGDLLHYHFSADEMYILPILIVAFFEHLVVLFLAIWSAITLKSRQLLHSTYKLFMFSVFVHVSEDRQTIRPTYTFVLSKRPAVDGRRPRPHQ